MLHVFACCELQLGLPAHLTQHQLILLPILEYEHRQDRGCHAEDVD